MPRTAGAVGSDFYLLWMAWLYRYSGTQVGLLPSPPLWGLEASHHQTEPHLLWRAQKAHSPGSTVMGAALPDNKGISDNALMHKTSKVKLQERGHKGVRWWESRPTVCKCFPLLTVGIFFSLPHSLSQCLSVSFWSFAELSCMLFHCSVLAANICPDWNISLIIRCAPDKSTNTQNSHKFLPYFWLKGWSAIAKNIQAM